MAVDRRESLVGQPFVFDYDPAVRLLRLKLIGLWDGATLGAFAAEARTLRDRVERAGHRDDEGRILIDLTDFPVQPKNITEGIGQLLPTFGQRAGRIALVKSGSALQTIQVQRLIASEKAHLFAVPEEALAWLSAS